MKVNVFVSYPDDQTSYNSFLCASSQTIKDVFTKYNLSIVGARVYLDGAKIEEKSWNLPLSALKARDPAFISVKYGVYE